MDIFSGFNSSVLFLIKIAVWAFLTIYLIFAGVVVRQVKLMTETLEVGFEKGIRFIALFHLIVAFSVFALALIIL
ncbi:hypothetical protein A2686_03375 [Candidatus Woesebacteria bacterium RIFCSPHIGHO2_01_FULL_38_10]|nr:MAG: hypothetical protein A2686_03375 [Candidatus Woesebacteria bacterium RIFCSPHIGHO2_01_FULL_38_10]